ncbi:MAG: galactose-1-phosphate uridylyltransferase, partial [Lachnospiraceae bacterium]|nr:galactose-1-phosphate uridylyltransferase [Lachnospiraceae bacterium]
NADLPIVGGSILSHDHFQGGNYEFPMVRAPYEKEFTVPGYEDVHAGIINWPLSTIRLQAKDADKIVELADHILGKWRAYTDEEAFIYAETDGTPHNTITPIARMRGELFELDLVLRNNITTDEHPMGEYHPHPQYHHIKKENIGLIEVMGLAVLPARLKGEMAHLEELILKGEDLASDESIASHVDWAKEWMKNYDDINASNIHQIVQDEIGKVFSKVLECAGVYKCTEEGRKYFDKFINQL